MMQWLKKEGTDSRFRFTPDGKYCCKKTKNGILVYTMKEGLPDLSNKTMGLCEQCFSITDRNELHGAASAYVSNKIIKICPSCFKDNYFVCSKCGKRHHVKDKRKVNNELSICGECYSTHYGVCESCHKVVEKSSMVLKEYGNFCMHCIKTKFKHCVKCGTLTLIYNLYTIDGELVNQDNLDHGLCNICLQDSIVLKEYNYIPTKTNMLEKEWENKELKLGFELEVEPYVHPSVYDSVVRYKNFKKYSLDLFKFLSDNKIDDYFYMKKDGSVRGFELVSKPFTLQFAHDYFKLKLILDWMKKQHWTSYSNGRCGLHVHMSKAFFNKQDIIKLHLFFKLNANELVMFSKRVSEESSVQNKENEYKWINQYCNFNGYEETPISSFINGEYIKQAAEAGKYVALNMNTKKPTIEIRIFRGTLYYNRFIASLQFCEALAYYVKEVSIPFILKTDGWNNFIQWCKEKHRYDKFIDYVNKYSKTKELSLNY